MRLSKIPIPLLIAALVATTAVVVYLQLSVVSVPVVADPNFTTTLVAGTPYMWRGAASEFDIASNATIKVTYMPMGHVIYLNGPLSNTTLGSGKWLIYLKGGRPLLVEKVTYPNGYSVFYVFKLVNMTKVNGLSVLVPNAFAVTDTLTGNEYTAILSNGANTPMYRVTQITTNGTHIMVQLGDPSLTQVDQTDYFQLPSAVDTTAIKITSSGFGVSYVVNGTTVSAYVMPYTHIVIVPHASAKVVITVK